MSVLIWIPLLLLAVALVTYAILLYNGLIALRNNVDRAWANVDVVLKQRADEIPRLAEIVRGYARHEQGIFEQVSRARATLVSGAQVHDKAEASEALSRAVPRLVAVAEAYPGLKASESFLGLQRRVSGLEDLLADRREFYNDSVAHFNTRIQEFPDVLVASRMGLEPRDYFEADASTRRA